MNPVIFLDYYHPYAGLCNQLYLITNHITETITKNTQIYINKFNIDIFKKERVDATEIFDFVKTNENIKKFINLEPIIYSKPEKDFVIPRLCIYPVASIEILNCLEFNEKIYKKIPKLPKKYTGIHFRLDIDVIIHYLFGKDVYDYFMKNSESINLTKLLLNEHVKNYIDYLFNQYTAFISQIGFDDLFYICTSIGKSANINDSMNFILEKLINFIKSNGGTVFTSEQYYPQRELNALVDLLVLRNSTNLVGFQGSSFSEGYVLKVNSIRKNINKCLFINGIISPLLDEYLFYSNICK